MLEPLKIASQLKTLTADTQKNKLYEEEFRPETLLDLKEKMGD